MAISFNWSNAIINNAPQTVTTFNVGTTNPAGSNGTINSGDFLLACVMAQLGTAADPGTITVTGFTPIQQVFSSGQNVGGTEIYVGYKIAGASESGSYAANWTTTSRDAGWALLDYGGVTNSSPVDVNAETSSTGFSVNMVAPSIAPLGSSDMLICVWFTDGSQPPFTQAPGMNKRVDVMGAAGGNSGITEILVADLQLSSSGATGTKTATQNAVGTNMAVSLALIPGGILTVSPLPSGLPRLIMLKMDDQ